MNAPARDPARESPLKAELSLSEEEHELVQKMNELRRQKGLKPFELDASLQFAAVHHSEYMAKESRLTHDEPSPFSTHRERIPNAENDFMQTGENVSCSPDADTAYERWFASPGHYMNMVNPDMNRVGIARRGTGLRVRVSGCSFHSFWTMVVGSRGSNL